MRKSIKRVLSVALAATVAVSGVAYTGTKASAASSYKAVMGYADTNWNWDGGNDSSKDTNKTAVSVKNKKGTATYTVPSRIRNPRISRHRYSMLISRIS